MPNTSITSGSAVKQGRQFRSGSASDTNRYANGGFDSRVGWPLGASSLGASSTS